MLFHNRPKESEPRFPSRRDVGHEWWWDLWKSRQYPFNTIEQGTHVVLVDSWTDHGRTIRRLTWEVEVDRCLKERYQTKTEAIAMIARFFKTRKDAIREEPYAAATAA